jgi:predicted deacetylase
MNYENFSLIRSLFHKYQIKPIIGVIPNNEDIELKRQAGRESISQERFWSEIRELKQKHGWAIALHGYNHVYVTNDSGIFNINPCSEFAGLPLSLQEEKIRKGKAIFELNGLAIDAFMAPGHSMDWITVEALKKNDIFVVTDGYCAYPYERNGMLFVPQVWARPHKGLYGVDTTCFHINFWESHMFERLERFVQENRVHCGTFWDVVSTARSSDSLSRGFINWFSHNTLKGARKIKTFAFDMKRKINSMESSNDIFTKTKTF